MHNPPRLRPGYFGKFQQETLFYIFYSMPGDEAQLYAAGVPLTLNSGGQTCLGPDRRGPGKLLVSVWQLPCPPSLLWSFNWPLQPLYEM